MAIHRVTGNYSLDLGQLLRYGNGAKEEQNGSSERWTTVLRASIYAKRAGFDSRSCADLCGGQSARVGQHGLRVVGVEARQRCAQRGGMRGFSGAFGVGRHSGIATKQQGRPVGSKTSIPVTERGNPGAPLDGRVEEFTPLVIERVQSREQRLLFRELVGRHHYLGYAVPYGARLQYLFLSANRSEPWWGACNFPVRLGGCRRGISGLAGTMRYADATFSTL